MWETIICKIWIAEKNRDNGSKWKAWNCKRKDLLFSQGFVLSFKMGIQASWQKWGTIFQGLWCIESFPWQYIEFFNWPIWWFCQLGDFPLPFPSAATMTERRQASGSLNTSTIQLTYNGCRSKGLRISSGFKLLCSDLRFLWQHHNFLGARNVVQKTEHHFHFFLQASV